MEKQQFSIG